MTNTEVLTVEADSERGTITVQGRIFLGGVYDVDITLNKAACDATYRVAFFTYENRAKPLYLGIVGGLGEDGKRGRISFSNGDLIDCYRPQSRVWNASIPIYAYLYQALPVNESEKAELPDYQQDGFADPIHIIAEGRFDLLWTPILGEKTLANEKVVVAAVGPQGPTGEKGDKGRDGVNGITYKPQLRRNADGDIFVDWLEKDKDGEYTVVAYQGRTNIKGDKGERGESSFEVAKNNGFVGDEQTWIYTVQNVSKNADRAKDAAEAAENAQKSVAEYVDTAFPTKAHEAEQTLKNATTSGVNSVTQRANQAVGALDGKLATASTAINEAVERAETAKGDAVKAQGEASKSAEQASTSAYNASKSAEQAESAKNAIGDVGGRLEAVETSVADKVPYISGLLRSMFDLIQGKQDYRIKDVYWCHEGFILRNFQGGGKGYFLRPKDGQWQRIVVGTIKLIAIQSSQTTIYATSGSKIIRAMVTGQGASLQIATEEIAALPANVSAYSEVYAYQEANGFYVTTNGLILNSDLTETGTTFAVTDGKKLLKNGQVFKYLDSSVKAFMRMKIGADGVPTFTQNGYTQDAAQTFIPTKTKWGYCRFNHNRLTGIADWNNGYVYKQMTANGILQCVISDPFDNSFDRNCGYFFVTDGNCIFRVMAAGNYELSPSLSCEAIGLLGARMDYNVATGGILTSNTLVGAFQDVKGNVFIAEGQSFSYSSRTFYTILAVKEAQ